MRTFAHIQHYAGLALLHERTLHYNDVFGMLNQRGAVTNAAISVIAVAVATYLIAVYSLFGLAVTLQQKTTAIRELNESNTITELNLQQKQTGFARNNQDVLQSMEKISDMRYVMPADTAVSRADISGQSSQ